MTHPVEPLSRTARLGIVHVIPGGAPRASALFAGDDFMIYLPGLNEEGNVGPNVFPTQAGSTLTTSSLWVIPSTFGSAAIGAHFYPRLAYGGPIQFTGAPITLTQEMLINGVHQDVTFSARLKGYYHDAFIPEPPDPTVTLDVVGQATLYVTFKQDTPGSNLYDTSTIEYVIH